MEGTDKSFGAESSPAAKDWLKLKGSLEKDLLQKYILYTDRLENVQEAGKERIFRQIKHATPCPNYLSV